MMLIRIVIAVAVALAAALAWALRPHERWGRVLGREDSQDGRPRPAPTARRDFSSMTRTELYEEAKRLDIPGRSGMTKDQLLRAIAARARGPDRVVRPTREIRRS